MIKIGETHAVGSARFMDNFGLIDEYDVTATEAVKRQIYAHENLLIAIGMGWELAGVISESKFALSPFTDTHASLVDSGPADGETK